MKALEQEENTDTIEAMTTETAQSKKTNKKLRHSSC